jgi:23S rRNA (cytidine1920-2'-O)/16S rRNA (cytidine1409-2'-O)-methyltransferase
MSADCPYAGRGGLKLRHALDHFDINVAGCVSADLGSHVGGFVDCLLQAGAAKVYSVDTSYGTLAWELRNNPDVIVIERQNAMHVELPEKVDLVTVDVGWTRQAAILPRALELVKDGGRILSLLKPQYESTDDERVKGIVKPECVDNVVQRTLDGLEKLGIVPEEKVESPIVAGDSRTNREFFLLFAS